MKKIIALALAALTAAGTINACSAPEKTESGDRTPEPVAEAQTETPELKVKKLEIAKKPDKLVYELGEELDDTGAVVNAIMSDGSVVENVPYTAELGEAKKSTHAMVFYYEDKMVYQVVEVVIPGNTEKYYVANTPSVEGDALEGKRIFFLGSSVTFGAQSGEEGIPEFMDKVYGTESVKEARSGTTLAISKEPRSYVERLDEYIANGGSDESFDFFVCQLSTNDTSKVDNMGEVMPDFLTDASGFDKNTTVGAIEYIIATARDTWNCPIIFYTNPPYGLDRYGELVEKLHRAADKWDITIIDLYNNEEFNAISDEEYNLYMADSIHPTRAGYRDWWLPAFHDTLTELAGQQLTDNINN